MKALIAGACLTIMAAGAYYGTGEYEARQDAKIVAAWQDRQRCETLKAKAYLERTDAERDQLLDCNRRGILKYQ